MELDNNSHSVFLLNYHLVLVVKYRNKVFDNNVSNRAKAIFEYIAPNYNITLLEWNHDSTLKELYYAYKSSSSRLLKKEYQDIRKQLWEDKFWSQSFCLLTTGGAPIEVIKKYIESQGRKIKC